MQIGLVHNCLEPGQFTPISMVLIRYSCGHISGHHEPIHVKFGVWGFFIMFYGHENAEMQKRKFDDVTLQYSIAPTLLHIHTGITHIHRSVISTHRPNMLRTGIKTWWAWVLPVSNAYVPSSQVSRVRSLVYLFLVLDLDAWGFAYCSAVELVMSSIFNLCNKLKQNPDLEIETLQCGC